MATPYRLTTTFWDHATIWSDDESLAGHTTDGGRVFGITRTRYSECDRYGCKPVAVIAYEDREQVARFEALYLSDTHDECEDTTECMQAALRQYANPTPPKPAEPTGLGAVVEDADGRRWLRCFGDPAYYVWRRAQDFDGCRSLYAEIDAVRVLSEGVTA